MTCFSSHSPPEEDQVLQGVWQPIICERFSRQTNVSVDQRSFCTRQNHCQACPSKIIHPFVHHFYPEITIKILFDFFMKWCWTRKWSSCFHDQLFAQDWTVQKVVTTNKKLLLKKKSGVEWSKGFGNFQCDFRMTIIQIAPIDYF